MIARLATDPQAFVDRQSKYPGIGTQSILALAVGIAFALGHAGNYALLGDELQHVNQVIWVQTVINLAIPFVLWGVVTVGIYFIARFFEGYFPPELLFRLTGWGLAPLIGAGLVQSAGRLYALRDATPPAEPSFSAFEFQQASYDAYADAALSEPAFLVGTLLAIPFVLYSGYLWALVVERISDVDTREALYISAVPTLVCLLWIASPFLL